MLRKQIINTTIDRYFEIIPRKLLIPHVVAMLSENRIIGKAIICLVQESPTM